MKQVVISVRGGVAEIAYASDGVEIAIVDLDNAKAEGKSGEHKLRYWIARAKRDEKTPNAAVTGAEGVPCSGLVGTEHPHPMLCFQHGGSEACEAENRKHGFTCPKCSNKEISTKEHRNEQ